MIARGKVVADLVALDTRELHEALEVVPGLETAIVQIRLIEAEVESHLAVVVVAMTEERTDEDTLETGHVLGIGNNLDVVLDQTVRIGNETSADGRVQVTGVGPNLVLDQTVGIGNEISADGRVQVTGVGPNLVLDQTVGIGNEISADGHVRVTEVGPDLVLETGEGDGPVPERREGVIVLGPDLRIAIDSRQPLICRVGNGNRLSVVVIYFACNMMYGYHYILS